MSNTAGRERTRLDPKFRLLLAFYRARGAWRRAWSALAERQDYREFAASYRGLARREDIVYMFFTTDLLRWLDRALAFVPAAVNLVLIGSDLSADEISWIRSRYDRPFHHIRSRVDDNTVLDFAFRMAEHNFGWLHVDCFVLNPRLFADMAAVADDVAANCIWSRPSTESPATLHSAFVFLNFSVIQKLRASGIEVSPGVYTYGGTPFGRMVTHRKLYSRLPTRRHVELLGRVLPLRHPGLRYPQHGGYALGVLGLVLAAIGIYGVLAFSVNQRLREIGIRSAMGAEPGQLRSLVLGWGLRLAAIGLAVGALGSLAIAKLLSSQLYQVSSHDPVALGTALASLGVIAVLASYLPARRAATIDPVSALRHE